MPSFDLIADRALQYLQNSNGGFENQQTEQSSQFSWGNEFGNFEMQRSDLTRSFSVIPQPGSESEFSFNGKQTSNALSFRADPNPLVPGDSADDSLVPTGDFQFESLFNSESSVFQMNTDAFDLEMSSFRSSSLTQMDSENLAGQRITTTTESAETSQQFSFSNDFMSMEMNRSTSMQRTMSNSPVGLPDLPNLDLELPEMPNLSLDQVPGTPYMSIGLNSQFSLDLNFGPPQASALDFGSTGGELTSQPGVGSQQLMDLGIGVLS